MNPNSIVDVLKQKGMASDFLSRSNLAKSYGINGYSGSPDQNAQLIKLVSGGSPAPSTTVNNGGTTTDTNTNKNFDYNTAAKLAGEKGVSFSDFKSILDAGSGGYNVDTTKINNDLGITDLESKLFTAPSKSTESIFNEAYATAGIDKVDQSIKDLMDQIATQRENLKSATDTINNNPFLSEKTRVGQGKLRLDQAENDINNKNNELTLLQNWRDKQIANIKDKILMSTNDFNTTQDLNAKKLDYLLKKRDTMVATQTAQNKAQYTGQALLDYLMNQPNKVLTNGTYWDPATEQWVQQPSKKTTGSGGSGGSGTKKVTAAQQKQNSYEIINQLLAPGVTMSDGTPYLDNNGFLTPKAAQALMQSALTSGVSRKDFLEAYGNMMFSNGGKYDGYGLTPAEKKALGAE